MKKLVMIAVAALAFSLTTSNTATAQGISVELDLAYNMPSGDYGLLYDGGVGIAIHPRFKINDKMAVGLNIGGNGFIGGDYEDPSNPTATVSAAAVSNILGTIQYKLLDKNITPYGELGVGMFNYKSGSTSLAGTLSEDKTYIGFAPKIGAMVGFLNVHASFILAGDVKYTQVGLGFRFGAK